jgi:metallophosphoesterase (TIGR00282 family)
MKILYCGDVVGRSGRDAIHQYLPSLRQQLSIDLTIVNGENAAHGFGINKSICQDFYKLGVDVITTGNHIWDQKEIISYIGNDKRLIRPINYPATSPGSGFTLVSVKNGRQVLVINAMGRLFMDPLDDPFAAVDSVLKKYPLGGQIAAIVVDFHGEASSEKMAMGHFCDGRTSLVIGSHAHIPTADAQILPKGTAYQTDAGMCGDYNSVIGMDKDVPVARFTRKMPTDRLTPAQGPGTLCGVFIETDDATGLAKMIYPVRLGPRLINALPPFQETNDLAIAI